MKKRKIHDPWAEYGPPVTTFAAAEATRRGEEEAAKPKRRPTIDELECILNSDREVAIEIAPNGEIVTRELTEEEKKNWKPITLRENLGGEYASQ